jgi:PAS domain S-box-containing protein
MNILIVDDLAENVCLLQALLEGAGYGVISARNGKEALEHLREGTFAVIVSDILMPVMDGFQLCRECKTNPEWARIPFVIYTATYTEKKDEEFALTLGADRFVVKPQEPERFLKIIKEVLDLPRHRANAVAKSPSPDENAYLSIYNKRVVRKLEKKVADLERINLALRESEKKYRLLADNVEDVIFVLDMNLDYVYISPSVKTLRGYEPEEVLRLPASGTLTPASWDLAMKSLADGMALEKTGQGDLQRSRMLELEVRRRDGSTVWTEMRLSFIRDENNQLSGILGVTRDITQRKQAEGQLKQTLESFRKAVSTTIQVMVSAVEARDPYTAGHQIRSANIAHTIAMEMGLPQEKIEGIRVAGSIHDIGKLSIPAEILSKPTKLSELEFSLIKNHSRSGYEILKDVESSWPLAEIVYQHHERMDGSGYPRNLKGEEILIEARILAVADVVEAMASHRPYRPGLGIDAALNEIEKNRGIFYDNTVADACLRLFREKGFKLEKA